MEMLVVEPLFAWLVRLKSEILFVAVHKARSLRFMLGAYVSGSQGSQTELNPEVRAQLCGRLVWCVMLGRRTESSAGKGRFRP